MFKMFRNSESGATLVEYGVAVILAIVVGGTGLTFLANQTDTTIDCGATTLTQRPGTTPSCS